MTEAQEMFKASNKVSRPEKALILGFMAGSRGLLFIVINRFYYTDSIANIDKCVVVWEKCRLAN